MFGIPLITMVVAMALGSIWEQPRGMKGMCADILAAVTVVAIVVVSFIPEEDLEYQRYSKILFSGAGILMCYAVCNQ
jgi:hypothetical protein